MLGMGPGDPCVKMDESGRVRLVMLGPSAPLVGTFHAVDQEVSAEVAGPDSEWLAPYLPTLLGLDFRPPQLAEPNPLRRLARRFEGFRLPRSPMMFPFLIQIVLQQLVSSRDARQGWRSLVRRHGERVGDLWAPPRADVLARMATYQFIECGILPLHGRRIIGLASMAKKIERLWGSGRSEDAADRTCQFLMKQRGVGPWTKGYLRGSVMGDSDAVVLGDYGFPKRVAYFFTGEEQADDDDMLRLLDPYRPHRFYVLSLLLKGATPPPRRGPRRRPLRNRLHPPR
jgi:3-methyladenine DNA glycosylase/8-oxoguanine DNA glycosylase